MQTAPAAPPPPRRATRRARLGGWLRRQLDRDRRKLAVWTLIAAFVVLYFWRSIFVSIESGEAGVRWNRFTGTVPDRVYGEGMAVIFPWDKMYVYPVRLQSETDSLTMLTVDGLTINMIVTTRFYPNVRNLARLHARIGPDYRDKIVFPEVVSSVRRTIGNRAPHEIYSENAFVLQREIFTTALAEIDPRYVVLDEVLIQKLTLPAKLQEAIRDKLATEQAALAYAYRLDAERSEAARKQIEADGIRDFEARSGVPILRWRGLSVTEELAKSPNAKLIVVPTGSESLPIILNP